MAKKVETILSVLTGNAVKSVAELRININKYKNDLVSLDKDSKEYNQTLGKLAKSQKQLNEINLQARSVSLSFTQQISQTTRVVGGITAGYQAYQSIVSLTGVENEKLAQTFVKLQAIQGLVGSLQSVASGFTALRTLIPSVRLAVAALNRTLSSNVIGAIAVGAIALTTAFIGLRTSIRENKGRIQELNEEHKNFNDSLTAQNKELEYNIRLLRASGGTEQDVIEAKLKNINNAINERTNRIREYAEEIKELDSQINEFYSPGRSRLNLLQNLIKTENDELEKALKERDSITEDSNVNQRRLQYNAEQERLRIQQQAARQRLAELQQEQKKEEQARRDFAATSIAIEQDAQKRIKDSLEGTDRLAFVNRQIVANQKLQESLKIASEDQDATDQQRAKALGDLQTTLREYYALVDERNQLDFEIGQANAARDIADIERAEQLIELEERLRIARNPEELSDEEQLQRIVSEGEARLKVAEDDRVAYELRVKALEDYTKSVQDAARIQKKIDDDSLKSKQEVYKKYASVLNDASTILADNTTTAKVLAGASATISAYAGSAQTLGDPTLPFIKKIPAALTVLATGISAVRNIASTSVPGSSSEASSTITPLDIPVYPDITEMYEPEPTQAVRELQSLEERELRGSSRVYIVESDIQNSNNRVHVRNDDTNF